MNRRRKDIGYRAQEGLPSNTAPYGADVRVTLPQLPRKLSWQGDQVCHRCRTPDGLPSLEPW